MTSPKNPIERRLELITDSWSEFADSPEPRVLIWLATADEVPMVDTFIASEADPRVAALPDLFVRLVSPFHAAQPYGGALHAEFVKIAEGLQAGLADPETPAWVPPAWQRGEDDVDLLVKTCSSFVAHYALPGLLALALRPTEVSDTEALQVWLQRFAGKSPENVRAIVLDDAREPETGPLARAEPVRVMAQPLNLDMPGARLEISEAAGGLDTPGGQFRHLFVKLSNALGEGKLPEALGFGQAALAISSAQSWFALAVPIHFALGAALAGVGRTTEANERYLAAESSSIEGEKAGDPLCTKLRAQSRMVRGSLLIQARQYPGAAQLYTDTIPIATQAGDPRMVLDCYRLASFSHEQSGQFDKSWQSGVDGLGYAKQLDDETRKTSTLPYLGETLMRLTQRAEYSASSLRIEREMVSLMGRTDWRPENSAPAQPSGAA